MAQQVHHPRSEQDFHPAWPISVAEVTSRLDYHRTYIPPFRMQIYNIEHKQMQLSSAPPQLRITCLFAIILLTQRVSEHLLISSHPGAPQSFTSPAYFPPSQCPRSFTSLAYFLSSWCPAEFRVTCLFPVILVPHEVLHHLLISCHPGAPLSFTSPAHVLSSRSPTEYHITC